MTPEITGWPFHLLPTKRANKKTFPQVAATKKTSPPKTGGSNHLNPFEERVQTIRLPIFRFPIFWPLLSREIAGSKSSPKKSMYSFHSLILHKKGHTQFLDFKPPGSPQTFPRTNPSRNRCLTKEWFLFDRSKVMYHLCQAVVRVMGCGLAARRWLNGWGVLSWV